jgi:clan AA aspartic protease
MITGNVTADLEAIVPLIVLGASGQQQPLDAVLDTGFSGYLTLPPGLIASLGLAWLGREQGILADGSVELFDVYRAAVLWDGRPRPVEVDAADGSPLLGMALLQGHELRMEVVAGGGVSIVALP